MKILEFFGEPISYGGQESFIVNMYKNYFQNDNFCFFTPFHADNRELINLANNRGDIVYAYGKNFDSRLRKAYIFLAAKRAMKIQYDVIHIHSGSILTLLMVSSLAKKRGIKKIIVHSHATGYDSFSHKLIKSISDKLIENKASLFLACSYDAGIYKFPEKILKSDKFQIIKNGIDLQSFLYDGDTRIKKRKELNIKEQKVLCHVGRFSEEKNHKFIIALFEEYLKLEKTALLLLVGGAGRTEKEIMTMVSERNLSDKVIILKNRKDINELLCVADVFVFPSRFEGLGISAIEAQANGLPTICAEQLPAELDASSVYIKMSLDEGPKKWAEKVYSVQDNVRVNTYSDLKMAGYDVSDLAKQLGRIYREN